MLSYPPPVPRSPPGGRLSLSSTEPWLATDQSAQSTLHYLSYKNDSIVLWDGARLSEIAFTDPALALGTMVPGAGYDVFGYLSGGSLSMELYEWLNMPFTVNIAANATFTTVAGASHGIGTDGPVTFTTTGALPTGLSTNTTYYLVGAATTSTYHVSATVGGTSVTTSGTQSGTHTMHNPRRRNTNNSFQNGRMCKGNSGDGTADPTRLLLGSLLATTSTTTDSSVTKQFVSNYYNREEMTLTYHDTSGAAWAYNVATWRQARAQPGAKVEVFLCDAAIKVDLFLNSLAGTTSAGNILQQGIGVGTILLPDPCTFLYSLTANEQAANSVRYNEAPGLGWRTFYLSEKGNAAGTNNFYGYLAQNYDCGLKGNVYG